MASETELERMVFRLVGDSAQFKKMLDQAEREVKETTKEIKQAMTKIEQLEKKLENSSRKFVEMGNQMKKVGQKMTLAVTAPLVGLGTFAVREFAKFDNAMVKSTSIMGNLTQETQDRMRELATTLSENAIQAPAELAESYFFLASAGLNAEQSMAALPVVMDFATAGAFDMARATDLLTDAQSALGMTVDDSVKNMENMVKLSDILVKANTLANATVEQFSTALTSKAGAAIKAYNIDLENGVAVLAAYADQGIKAELAGNALDRMIRLLTKAAADNAEAFRKMGVDVFDINGEFRDFADIIEDIEVATKDMSTEQKAAALEMLGFEARVQQVILPLLGASDSIRQYTKELKDAQGVTKEVAEKQMRSFTNEMKVFMNQVRVAAIELGETLAPMVRQLTEFLKEAINNWRELSPATKEWIVQIGILVAAIGPLLTVLGIAINLLAGPGGLLIALTVTAAAAAKFIFSMSGASAALREFNKESATSTRLSGELGKALDKQTRGIIRDVKALEGGANQAARIAEEIDLAENNLEGAIANANRAQAQIKPVRFFGLFGGKKENDAATQRFKELSAVVDKARERLGALRRLQKDLDNEQARQRRLAGEGPRGAGDISGQIHQATSQVNTFFDVIKRGATGAGNALTTGLTGLKQWMELMKRGQQVTKEFRTPIEKFNDRQKELTELLNKGAISRKTFNRAIKAAGEELENARDKLEEDMKVKVEFDVSGIQAARFGSAEAVARLEQFRALRGFNFGGDKQPKGPTVKNLAEQEQKKSLDLMNTSLERIVELLEEGGLTVIQGAGAGI